MTRKELGVILNIKTTIEPIRKCWFIRDRDWSNYTTINGEKAHRLVYRMCIGSLIEGMFICHRCDRKGCINPTHLYQGTHSDNMKDARLKHRLKKLRRYVRARKKADEIANANWDRKRFGF